MKLFALLTACALGLLMIQGDTPPDRSRVTLPPCTPGEIPHAEFLDLPEEWRQKNFGPSCSWATTISMLRAQGFWKEAAWIRANCRGGAGPQDVNPVLDKLGIKYAWSLDGDETLINYALATNRGCGVHWPKRHATMLVGKRDGWAVILDNNQTHKYRLVEWDKFLRELKANKGWVWCIVDPRGRPLPELTIHP